MEMCSCGRHPIHRDQKKKDCHLCRRERNPELVERDQRRSFMALLDSKIGSKNNDLDEWS